MKSMKRIVTLALALMMAFSTLVMPAMATNEDEGIMPRKPTIYCDLCHTGSATRISSERDYNYAGGRHVNSCSNMSAPHTHIPYRLIDTYVCDNCQHRMTFYSGYDYYVCRSDSSYPS